MIGSGIERRCGRAKTEGIMSTITRRSVIALPVLAAAASPVRAFAADTVKIGYIEALTGNAAAAGQSIKQAAELALDIINNPHPELAPLTLATKDGGLANLGGAKVEIVWADNQGSPAVAQSDALRLITEDHVVALTGAYQSSCTLTSSAVAERYGIPYLAGESAAANLTGRGIKIAQRIAHNANGTDVSPQVLQLKQGHPDVVIFISYTSDSILYLKTCLLYTSDAADDLLCVD